MLNSNTWNYLILCKQVIDIKLNRSTWLKGLQMLNSNTWNHLKWGLVCLKIMLPANYILTNHMYKEDLALNNL